MLSGSHTPHRLFKQKRPARKLAFNGTRPSAGKIIDSCGLKGMQIGGAGVSLRHANFIVNKTNASSRDVLALMAKIKKLVGARCGIRLEPEIKIWR